MSSRPLMWIAALALALSLAGCGVRGSLEPPPGAKAEAAAEAGKPGEPPPHKGFILDGLLR
ncbi:MAG: lipoprotein [Hyphomicrobiaceae bacterium]